MRCASPSWWALANARRVYRLEADPVLVDGLGDLLTRCILATRHAEYDRCVRIGDDAVRALTLTTF